jgi:hypothetical protein
LLELACSECIKLNCSHIFYLRRKLLKKFKTFFESGHEYFNYLASVLNREIFSIDNDFISFSEYKNLLNQIKSKSEIIWEQDKLKHIILTFIFNSILKEANHQSFEQETNLLKLKREGIKLKLF